jgi:hypothetical protein
MTDSLIFTIKAIKRLHAAAVHTPTFIGCSGVSTMHMDFLNQYSIVLCFVQKKRLMSNNLQAKLVLKLFNSVHHYEPVIIQIVYTTNCSILVEVLEVM